MLLPHIGETERFILSDAIRHELCWLQKNSLEIPFTCSSCQSLTVPRACRSVLPHAALCCCAPHCLQALSPSLLSPCHLRSEPPALLRCAQELLLGTAVSLHQGALATSSLCPTSPAQLSTRRPAQGIAIPPRGALLRSPRTSGTERQLKTSLRKSKSEASFLQCPPEGQH